MILSIGGSRKDIPRSLTRISPVETIDSSSAMRALRFLRVFLVEGSKRPMRLWSLMRTALAMRILTPSTVVSGSSSMEAGRFLRGFLGAVAGQWGSIGDGKDGTRGVHTPVDQLEGFEGGHGDCAALGRW